MLNDAVGWIQPIQRQNLSESAYSAMREALMQGRLMPGEELPLRPISRSFGISATPMREALLRLVSEHALEMDARGRISVPHLTREALLEIRKIRIFLEGTAAREAAMRRDPDGIATLEAIHEALLAAQMAKDFPTAIGLNTQFHLKLCDIGRLPISYELASNLWVRCGPLLSHLYEDGIPPALHSHPHIEIIAAIRTGDAARAHDALVTDIEQGGARLLEHVRG